MQENHLLIADIYAIEYRGLDSGQVIAHSRLLIQSYLLQLLDESSIVTQLGRE